MDNNIEDKFIGNLTGIVKHFARSYGFIRAFDDSVTQDVFVHYKDIDPKRTGFKELVKGDKVKFELWRTARGLGAKNVIPHQGEGLLTRGNDESRHTGHTT